MERQRNIWRWIPFLLPILHFCLCAIIALGNHGNGGWTWFPVFYIDFPFSILLLPFLGAFPHPFIVFGIAGTFWWLMILQLLGMAFHLLGRLVQSVAKRRA